MLQVVDMYTYKVFGLCIRSELRIPQFNFIESERADAYFKFGKAKHYISQVEGASGAVQVSGSEICLYWEQLGVFLIRNGTEVVIDANEGVKDDLLCIPLMGTVLAAMLHQRRLLVLHASSVAIDGEALVFLGWKGSGKSTTAALFYKRGHTMITDDIVALKNAESFPISIVPGYPGSKLSPEAALTILGDELDTLTPVHASTDKLFRPFCNSFLLDEAPLKAIYILDDGPVMRITRLSPQDAMSALIANTYLARYGNRLLQNENAMSNFKQCSNIASKVPVYRLERLRSFARLQEFGNFLESHARSA